MVNGLTQGKTNGAVAQVKAVNQATMVKDGERPTVDNGLIEQVVASTPRANVNVPQAPQNNQSYVPPPQNYGQQPPVDQYGRPIAGYPPPEPPESSRDAGLYAEMERRLNEMRGIQSGNAPQVQMNEGKVVPPQQQQYNPNNMLTEQITQTVTDVFKNMGSNILQEAMRDTIVETYKMERVKESILENKDVIKRIVIETIKELQNRKKTKSS